MDHQLLTNIQADKNYLGKAAILDHYPEADEIEFFKNLFKSNMVKIDIIEANFKCQKFAVSPFYEGMSMEGYEKLGE